MIVILLVLILLAIMFGPIGPLAAIGFAVKAVSAVPQPGPVFTHGSAPFLLLFGVVVVIFARSIVKARKS